MANLTAAVRRAHHQSLLTRQTFSQNHKDSDLDASDVEGEDFDDVKIHTNRIYAFHRFNFNL
ncbi:hypothetical protein MJO28_007835 [Puccinia striiformis f. sp. tritici]|uniref:Uncharacterized protein n=2 Tax=Puccinia striiformis TaxID=27350 RepID=A0A2S4WLE6_9BASI|nr:hypothetical protein MJO28_007835 [Puccinia striiformis f. sp. tritici]POW22578.1 hypothetical protein PSHT_01040 [Puccinia striiformis]